jgi:Flp pilus assembly protein TadG
VARSPNKKKAESGQSLVEFALFVPILLFLLLAVVNFGLAIRAHLQLAQLAQQGAQYLVHHPDQATSANMTTYLNGLSSYQLTSSQVAVTVGTSSIQAGSSTSTVQQDTVKITYPFQVSFPMAGRFSLGMLQSGSINIGATASTIAATDPVTNVHVCGPAPDATCSPALNKAWYHQITWDRPLEAEPAGSVPRIGLSIAKYCITAYITEYQVTPPRFISLPVAPVPCIDPPSSSTGQTYIDQWDYYKQDPSTPTQLAATGTFIYYSVVAEQYNGVQSAASSKVAN